MEVDDLDTVISRCQMRPIIELMLQALRVVDLCVKIFIIVANSKKTGV